MGQGRSLHGGTVLGGREAWELGPGFGLEGLRRRVASFGWLVAGMVRYEFYFRLLVLDRVTLLI